MYIFRGLRYFPISGNYRMESGSKQEKMGLFMFKKYENRCLTF